MRVMPGVPSNPEDVDQLLLNAKLRDELEPFFDEAIHVIDVSRMSTKAENEFLASMLAWERAPALPISQWFEPELKMISPDVLDDEELRRRLWDTIHRLYEQRIVLEFTDHLSDRQLYCLIARDILPSFEKKVDLARNYLHWHCLDCDEDARLWLTYYASDEERELWSEETQQEPPPRESPPFPRIMPRRPIG